MNTPDRLLKVKEVTTLVSASRSTVERWVKQSMFPKPVKIGSGTFWKHSDIQSFIAAQTKTNETGD